MDVTNIPFLPSVSPTATLSLTGARSQHQTARRIGDSQHGSLLTNSAKYDGATSVENIPTSIGGFVVVSFSPAALAGVTNDGLLSAAVASCKLKAPPELNGETSRLQGYTRKKHLYYSASIFLLVFLARMKAWVWPRAKLCTS